MKPSSRNVPPGGLLFPTLAVALLLSLGPGASAAADRPGGPDPAGTDNAAEQVAPAADNSWVDRSHSYVERDLFLFAAWFDRFFGDERMEVTGKPGSLLRWKNDFRWDEEEGFTYRTTVRAAFRLPRLKKRWRLVISGESKGDPTAVNPEDPGNPALDPSSTVRTSSTELIYDLLETSRSSLFVGAGVHLKLPPDAFVRTRFQHARPIGFLTLGRFAATAFWSAQDGFGETNQVDLERPLAPPTLLRWSNSMSITEKANGWTWGTELSLLHKLSPKSAVTFAGGASGSDRPAWIVQKHRVLVRYRRNVLRKWLYLEGEPDITWPRKEDGGRKPVWGGTLRVEILFTGTGPNPLKGE